MISLDALKSHGLTNEILKDIMTSEPPAAPKKSTRAKADERASATESPVGTLTSLEELPANPTKWDVRCHLETVINGEINEGMMRCAERFNRLGAIDLAYASVPIHPTTLPLMRVALGQISVEQCAETIEQLSPEMRAKIFSKDGKLGGKRPKLVEFSHNLVHSLTTRRVAALATEVDQQHPLLKFPPYSNNQTWRLTGDVMTQLTEQMAGAYGYRKDYEESIRHASLYSECIKFKASAWHREYQWLPKEQKKNGASKAGRPARQEFEKRIIREGVLFTIPHPSRVSYDISRVRSKLNQGLGPRWINHWEAVPINTIRHDKNYFNRDKIVMDSSVYDFFNKNPLYFSEHYDRMTVTDSARTISAAAMALKNDRVAQIGKWAELPGEAPTILHQHYKQIIPKDFGIGTYDCPVWIRFVMAGFRTCVYAEIVGSDPASINEYNCSDQLIENPSFALQALQWQEQLTNLINEMRHVQAQGLIRIFALNKHGMKKNEIEAVLKALKDPDYENLKDIIIEYDAEKLAQRGSDIKQITEKITQIRIETASKVTEIFQSMMNTLALAERQMFFSPQELGQVSARTTSATEQRAIRDTTLGIRDYHMVGVKQQMEADKRIIHSSYMAFGSEDLEVPVAERYEPKVIEEAGFEIVDDGTGVPPDGLYTLRGKKLGMFYSLAYSARNTDDTPPDAAVAQGLAQIYDVLSKDKVLSDNTTLDQRMELANSLFDKIAPGIFKLRVPEGTNGKQTTGGAVESMQKELQGIIPQIGKALEDMSKRLAQQEASTGALANALTQIANLVKPKAPRTPSTRRGQISPGMPQGAGAPPLSTPQPVQVPLIG